jgi:hypothetical protein
MKPQRYEEKQGTERLKYRGLPVTHVHGRVWPVFLMAGVFLVVGIVGVLAAFGVLSSSAGGMSSNAVGLLASTFAVASIGLLVHGFLVLRENRRRFEFSSDQVEMKDFPWDKSKFEITGWRPFWQNLGAAGFLTLFLIPFNWLVFGEAAKSDTHILVKGVIGLFDVLATLVWLKTGSAWWSGRKFGPSAVYFSRFPYRLGQPVTLIFKPPARMERLNSGVFTLRCVEEWVESSGSGKNKNWSYFRESKWTGVWHLDDGSSFICGESIDLACDPPAHLFPTSISGVRMFFWELEVRLDVKGMDFEAFYLIPIY